MAEGEGERIARLEQKLDDQGRRLGHLEILVERLRAFQSWVLGAFSAIAFLLGLASQKIMTTLGWKP